MLATFTTLLVAVQLASNYGFGGNSQNCALKLSAFLIGLTHNQTTFVSIAVNGIPTEDAVLFPCDP